MDFLTLSTLSLMESIPFPPKPTKRVRPLKRKREEEGEFIISSSSSPDPLFQFNFTRDQITQNFRENGGITPYWKFQCFIANIAKNFVRLIQEYDRALFFDDKDFNFACISGNRAHNQSGKDYWARKRDSSIAHYVSSLFFKIETLRSYKIFCTYNGLTPIDFNYPQFP